MPANKTKGKLIPPPERRKKRDKEGSKKALLEAAIEVFSEHGYDAATTREVAKRAGVSEALIQRYFKSKEGLLFEIMNDLSERKGDDWITELPLADKVTDEILQIINADCDHHAAKKSFMRVAVSRAIIDPKLGRQVGTKVHERHAPAITARLLHFQKTGAIRADIDLKALSIAISSLSFSLGFMMEEVFGLDKALLQNIKQQISTILARGASKGE